MQLKIEELRCDKLFLNSNFDGYKLSLNEIPGKKIELPYAVREVKDFNDNFSFLYMNLMCLHNHLIDDPWDKNSFYYINENNSISKIEIKNIDGDSVTIVEIFSIPQSSSKSLMYSYNANLVFPGPSYALLCDGTGLFYIINTGVRSSSRNWIIEYSVPIFGDEYSFTISDARYIEEFNEITLHCVTTAIINGRSEKKSNLKSYEELRWIILNKVCEESWHLKNTFQVTCKGLVRYAYFSPRCDSLYLESTKPINLRQDTEFHPTELYKELEEKESPLYYWQQSNDDIKVWFALPNDCSKDDLVFDFKDKSLKVNAKNLVIEGDLYQYLIADLTTWNIENRKVEIVLMKREEGLMWKNLIENDDQGQEIVDPILIQTIHDRLAHLCSETEDKNITADTGPAFNLGQLEACDSSTDEDSRLIAIDASTKEITHEVDIRGRQKLFNLRVDPAEAPYLCLRNDVDGCLWKLDCSGTELCKHIGTLNAFGYVLASKEYKYSTCSPDLSYSIVATKQNIYVYKQNCSVSSELKNRKTGISYSHVGKQYLINLGSTDEIVGLNASNEFLSVLTTKSYYLFRMFCIE